MSTLEEWMTTVREELTAYLVGVAVGRGAPLDDTASRIAGGPLRPEEN
jgi:hypothetical protein